MNTKQIRYMLLWLGILATSETFAGTLADIWIVDRQANRSLPVYSYQGEHYVAGEVGHEYTLNVKNKTGDRLLAVISIDGINIISGENARTNQRGYILDPYTAYAFKGWRKSENRTAAFYFTDLKDSYADRTGRPENVGVIGAALFQEYKSYERPAKPPINKDKPILNDSRSRMESIGTGHGRNEYSLVTTDQFTRSSLKPEEVLTLNYDTYHNLVNRGIIPLSDKPSPFGDLPKTHGYVPDP